VRNPVRALRAAGLAEGLSFLVLLGVAMPLKYWAGMPGAVQVAGWVHGVLFMVFCVALVFAARRAAWPLGRSALVLVAALLPFGPFVVDGRMLAWAEGAESREPRPG
jgi:integral membrane protein